jgi:HEAT repeat protein
MREPDPEKPATSKSLPAVLPPSRKDEIQKHIKELLSDDYAIRSASIASLGKYGEEAALALVETLLKKADHPHALTNFSDALAEIGKPSFNVIVHALGHILEVKRPEDVYLVESLVDLLALQHDRRAIAPLAEQLDKLTRAIKRNHDRQLVHCSESAKVRIHRILIDLGEKSGLEDLLEMLGDGRRRVRDGVVEAITRIGDRRALVALLRLYDIEEHVSFSGAQFIKEAFREIQRREHVALEDRLFKDLTPAERGVLDRLFPKVRNGKH